MAIFKFSPVQRKKMLCKGLYTQYKKSLKNHFNLDDRIYKIIYSSPEKNNYGWRWKVGLLNLPNSERLERSLHSGNPFLLPSPAFVKSNITFPFMKDYISLLLRFIS